MTRQDTKVRRRIGIFGWGVVAPRSPDVAAFRQAARPAVEEIAQDYAPAVRDYVLSLIQ